MFENFDPNNNKYLSLAEIDKGLQETYGKYQFPKEVVMRAF